MHKPVAYACIFSYDPAIDNKVRYGIVDFTGHTTQPTAS